MIRGNVKIWLLAVTVVGAVLRLWRVDSLPALNADEAAIGYNAYSLILTGKDEFGKAWPIHFTSFGDFKPGGYFYLVLPFVWALGLNVMAVRWPSVILGIAAIPVMYFLVRELFPDRDSRWGVVAAGVLAISPWQILFSRGGWETNAATFFMMMGTFAFIRAGRRREFYFLWVGAYLASLYTYHAARVVAPLLGLGLVWFYRGRFLPLTRRGEQVKGLGLAVVLGVVLALPLARDLFFGQGGISRASGVGLLADVGPVWRANDLRGQHGGRVPAALVRVLHNRVVTYGLDFMAGWAAHFDGDFLFISGDEIQRNKVPETGQLYMVELVFVVLGIFGLFDLVKRGKEGAKLVGWWLLVAPIPAAMTFQSPHAVRAHNLAVPLLVVVTLGIWKGANWVKVGVKSRQLRTVLAVAVILVYGYWFLRFCHNYFVHLSSEYPFATQWGFEELVGYTEAEKGKYEKVYVTDRYDQPYILTLFYSKYPPEKFQKEAVLSARDKFGFSTVRQFDKYQFEAIDWKKLRDVNGVLIVGTDEEIPDVEANVVKKIYFPSGSTAFDIVAR